ncbi:MAG: bifunctional adenosylcobinamide kinase/adenosylcobinamide-phosphate guanylyltransferase [Methyloligellaceae bacterium]
MAELSKVSLILGGARSGKSRYAEGLAGRWASHKVYLATGQAGDAEMVSRIAEHRERRGADWRTVEEPLHLVEALDSHCAPETVVLVDCLTLWLTNVMLEGREIADESERLVGAVASLAGPAIFVSNEVGLGIVPENAMARAFRDHQGRLNQQLAAVADLVVFMAAGLPMRLKGPGEDQTA